MSGKYQQAGFHLVRHDRLWQEHDTYKARGKCPEPSVCSQCGAVFHHGHWQWLKTPEGAHAVTCPACYRIHDHFPAGYITLKGRFFQGHREEIMNLVHHEEKRERIEHPLKRIMAEEVKGDEMLVTTTDIHLAHSIGEALHRAYQGNLEYHYNREQNLLRVEWEH